MAACSLQGCRDLLVLVPAWANQTHLALQMTEAWTPRTWAEEVQPAQARGRATWTAKTTSAHHRLASSRSQSAAAHRERSASAARSARPLAPNAFRVRARSAHRKTYPLPRVR